MTTLDRLHTGDPDRPALVFVHGLGGHPIDTWRNASGTEKDFWPIWLGEDLRADVWTLGYDAELSGWAEQAMPLPDQGDQVLDLLSNEQRLNGRRLVLIGHSLGGLVIKTLVVHAMTKGNVSWERLAKHILGIVFIATPHTGSKPATLASAMRVLLRANPQVGNLALHDHSLRTLQHQFQQYLRQLGIVTRTYVERRGIPIGKRLLGLFFGPRVGVVDASSGEHGGPGETAIPLAEDHISICKPADRSSQIHRSLCGFIREVSRAPTRTLPHPPPAPPHPGEAGSFVTREPGRLTGPHDKRLQPREDIFLGRETEVGRVLAFLRGDASATQVTGAGGSGKSEVCKAALKSWLEAGAQSIAYLVDVPDRAGPGELISRIGKAFGHDSVDTFEQLVPVMRPGVYYLDNLESVVEQPAGQDVLRSLRDLADVRLLVSSRVSVPSLFGPPILIDSLLDPAAIELFRRLWSGADALPDDAAMGRFVVGELGGHALSIKLTARLGDGYGYGALVDRWKRIGVALAQDSTDDSRLGSLAVSLGLSAEALVAADPGGIHLWVSIAMFPNGIPESLLGQLEQFGGWSSARLVLVRRHLLTRRGDRFTMLPPVARYALDAAVREANGFSMVAIRPVVRRLIDPMVEAGDRTASTNHALDARRWIVDYFGMIARVLRQEAVSARADPEWVQLTVHRLGDQFQFQAGVARELLREVLPALMRPASAFMRLGDLERRLGRLDHARDSYDQALAHFNQEQNGHGQANTLKGLGTLEERVGRPDQARTLYNQALDLFKEGQDGLGQANTLKSLGDLERRLGRPDEARKWYVQALELYQQEQSGLGLANTFQSLGDLEGPLGQSDQARTLYNQALEIFEQEQDELGQANTLDSLGDLEHFLGRPGQARTLYDQALALYQHVQSGLGQANTLQNLGNLERDDGRWEDATRYYERALALYAVEQEPLGLACTNAGLGMCSHALSEFAKRDAAMMNAFRWAATSNTDPARRYVDDALVEMLGGRDEADAWLRRHSP